MSAIVLKPGIVHYEVLGRGRPVIFLHGWVGSWRYWVPVLQAASTSFRAYAFDLWGFGETARNHRQYLLSNQVELLDQFLFEMGIGRVALVGHGLGALVALMYTLQFPDMVDRIMAISCPLEENMLNNRLRTSTPAALAEWLLPANSPISEPVRLEAVKADQQALLTSLENPANLAIKAVWEKSQTACLFVHGQNDPAVAPPSAELLADLPEQTHYVLFEESGHFPMLDETSKFNRLLVDFLTLDSAESPRQLQLKEEWKRRVR